MSGLAKWVEANRQRDVALEWRELEERVGGEALLDALLDELLAGTRFSQSSAFVVGGALGDALALLPQSLFEEAP